MILSIGDVTAAQALAYCMAQPGATADDCNAQIQSHMVNGAYCDGDVEITKPDPNGPIVHRCIPSNVIAQKLALENIPPAPAQAAAPASSDLEAARPFLVAGGVALGVAFLWWLVRQ